MIIISVKEEKTIPFLITISYLASFLLIRLMVLIAGSAESKFAQVAKEGLSPNTTFYIGRNIILFGHHIHHFYFGILLIAIAGWIAIVRSSILNRRHAAIIYGMGLGLFMDEIGLLLTWGNYYSGLTYLLSLFLIGLFLNIIFFPYFWSEVRKNLVESNVTSIIWNTLLSYTNFIKVADKVSEKTGKTERASLIFTGLMYLFVGILILLYPQFVYYWVAGIFLIQGVSSLVGAWQKSEDKE
ncbi:hypothetical protein BX659_1417 [Orenia metallireducens]|uniref:Uncharacterized protein n=1 Tax=Orenia metallireducens TaxID=1413210 RepID=A0A285IEM5_9FIRM|nr:hypothetical protein [Orenia metallireducens]PRX18816.1 hypothetical protein BX659_1417 [Orenia metallireducens]SNY46419.1 hypothetical protein SAMN06265827_1427 [Orenia metallireducens]